MTERRNPGAEGVWTDGEGDIWRRKGQRGAVLDPRRVRSLLRREGLPLVVWESFTTTRYEDSAAKAEAVATLMAGTAHVEDVVAHEWRTDDGAVLLMLEHLC